MLVWENPIDLVIEGEVLNVLGLMALTFVASILVVGIWIVGVVVVFVAKKKIKFFLFNFSSAFLL